MVYAALWSIVIFAYSQRYLSLYKGSTLLITSVVPTSLCRTHEIS